MKAIEFNTTSIGPKKVMIIDDCFKMTAILTHYLNHREEYETQSFNDEFQAMQNIRKFQPDVIILDVNLNSLNGFRVNEMVQSFDQEKIPTIYISAEKLSQKMAKSLGPKEYFLNKPLQKDQFLKIIEQVLENNNEERS